MLRRGSEKPSTGNSPASPLSPSGAAQTRALPSDFSLFLLDLCGRNLYKILDSCKQLTVSQGSGEDDTTGMVTIITGFQLEDPSMFSAPMQSAIQAAASASVEIKNVLEFYKQWKEMG